MANQGPDVVFVSSVDYEKAFDAAVDAASSRGLKPVFVDRRGGVIETSPTVAGSVVEPWKQRATSPRQTLENTLSLQRRTARFEFRPAKMPTAQLGFYASFSRHSLHLHLNYPDKKMLKVQ
mgnify:CR=1 FL=1